MNDFEQKVVLITGAGLGFGRAVAGAFAAEGAWVAANDLTPINVDDVVDSINQAGGRAKTFTGDVSKKISLQTVVSAVLDEWPRIDILVNLASVRPRKSLLELDEWDWRRVVDVNLTGAFLAIQTVGRVMREQGGGVILNAGPYTDSAEGHQAAFQSSRAAVLALTQAAAAELEPYNIRVNAICPSKANLAESARLALSLCQGDKSGTVMAVGEK